MHEHSQITITVHGFFFLLQIREISGILFDEIVFNQFETFIVKNILDEMLIFFFYISKLYKK